MKGICTLFNRSALALCATPCLWAGLAGCAGDYHNRPASHPVATVSPTPGEWKHHRTADGEHPDQHEQQMIWLMNRARQNPTEEGRWLADTKHPEIAKPRDQFRVNRRRLVRKFQNIQPRPPAAFDVRLYEAAKAHADRLVDKRAQNHKGQMKGIKNSGYPLSTCRGNVYSYAKGSLNAHAAFNIDWGKGWGGTQRGAEHRVAVMAIDDALPNVGIAGVWVDNTDKVGPYVVAANYCAPMIEISKEPARFVTGTVFVDRNNNDLFDPGEGLSGVKVESSNRGWYAYTAAGGGYAIPATATGPTTIVFDTSLGVFKREIDVGDQSVLLDLEL